MIELIESQSCNLSVREIHGMVEWLVSESMVMYYIHLFRDSMWPGGELAKPAAQPSDSVCKFYCLPSSIIHVVNYLLYTIS